MRTILSVPLFAATLLLAPVVLLIAVVVVVTRPHQCERERR